MLINQLWLCVEVCCYMFHLLLLYWYLIPTIGKGIQIKCLNYWGCQRYIKRTWLNYEVDLADGQWNDIRNSLLLLWTSLIGVSILHFILRFNSVKKLKTDIEDRITTSSSAYFHICIGLAFLYIQHGKHSIIVLIISIIGFHLIYYLRQSKFCFAIVWAFAVLILLFKESYRVRYFHQFSLFQFCFDRTNGGMYSWHLPANFLILRITSFCLDYHWAFCANAKQCSNSTDISEPTPKAENVAGNLDKDTQQVSNQHSKTRFSHRVVAEYNFINYLAYILYSPLYMAGPIISFNNFIDNMSDPDHSENVWLYGSRWLGCFALMEFLTNQYPFFAVIRSGMQLSVLIYLHRCIIT